MTGPMESRSHESMAAPTEAVPVSMKGTSETGERPEEATVLGDESPKSRVHPTMSGPGPVGVSHRYMYPGRDDPEVSPVLHGTMSNIRLPVPSSRDSVLRPVENRLRVS